jgi:hypothetical protein
MKFEKVNPATGAAAPGFSRGSDKYSKNHWSGHSNDGREVNFGRGPTKGNQDYDAMQGKHKEPPTRSLPANVKIKNPDYINGGAQVRTPGGTRAWSPSAGQNYNGNPDKQNFGRGPTKGNTQ